MAQRHFAIRRGPTLTPKPRTSTVSGSQQQPQQPHEYHPPQYQQQQGQPLQHYQGQPPPQHYQGQYPPQHYQGQQIPGQPLQPGQVPGQLGQQQPQSMAGTIGSGLLEGLTFGVGSGIAHRAVDHVMGPRTMNIEHTYGDAATGTAAPGMDTGATGWQQPDVYQQQEWQQPANPYEAPPMDASSNMSWGDQENAAAAAASSGGGNGNDDDDSDGGVLGSVWDFFK